MDRNFGHMQIIEDIRVIEFMIYVIIITRPYYWI
jgi:hypothetical protein